MVATRKQTGVALDQAHALQGWIERSTRRRRLLLNMDQPLTVMQLSRKTNIHPDTCTRVLGELSGMGITLCLNRSTGRNRLYWLTGLGLDCRALIDDAEHISMLRNLFPAVDWQLYGSVCFRHRAAVIKVLKTPMQPAEIKRRLIQNQLNIRISANNIRDVIRYLVAEGVVHPVCIKARKHPSYELTAVGQDLSRLLFSADMR